MMRSYILKAKKFAEPPFQSKKLRKKYANQSVIFGPFGGNFGPFGVIFGPFGVIFRPLWVILGHFWAISWHIWTNLWKVQIFLGVVGLAFRMYGIVIMTDPVFLANYWMRGRN